MNYAAFKDYLVTHLWKMGDQTVIASLDTLIATANAELDRDLMVVDRDATQVLSSTSDNIPLPPDFKIMRDVSIDGLGQMSYVTPAQLMALKANNRFGRLDVYSTYKGELLLAALATPEAPVSGYMNYQSRIPDFKTLDQSWVADNYFDVYLYCVLKHTGTFLREDERVPMWISLYGAALQSALESDNDAKYSGSPLQMQF